MIFNEVLELMKNPNKIALDKSLADCHVKGLFSLVLGGDIDNEGNLIHGTLTRVFIATKKISPFDIQLHSHYYDLNIGVISGKFKHHIATPPDFKDYNNIGDTVRIPYYIYSSPLNGGDGGNGLEYEGRFFYSLAEYRVPCGSEMKLASRFIHSVSCKKNTIWIVKECGSDKNVNAVLGTKFKTEGLYNKPQQCQIDAMFGLVFEKLQGLVNSI